MQTQRVNHQSLFVTTVVSAKILQKMAQANQDAANWIIKGATPSATGVGVSATAQAGAHPYPMVPFISSLHGALGAEIVDFLQGKESAEQALSDVEAAYITVAKEKGFL